MSAFLIKQTGPLCLLVQSSSADKVLSGSNLKGISQKFVLIGGMQRKETTTLSGACVDASFPRPFASLEIAK